MPTNLIADPTSKMPSTVFDQLLEPVEEFVQKQDRELPKHPNQTFGYYDFFRLLMYFFIKRGKSLKLFLKTELNKNLLPSALQLRPVPYSTFGEAFERFPVTKFQAVFQHLLSTVSFRSIPELATLGTLYCIDGSLFPVISSMQWAEYTQNHQSLKLHLCFELNRMLPVEFWVTAANFSERAALIKMLKVGVTYIADRGYMSFRVGHEVLNAKAHFVFRVKAGLLFTVTETLPIQLPKGAPAIFNNVTDELIRYTNDEFKHIYRLVYFSVGGEEFSILTDRRDLTTFQVIMLYALRWQIELLFRFLKRTMNGIHLIKQDQRGVTIQFYALLIAALLELRLKQMMAKMDDGDDDSSEKVCQKLVQGTNCMDETSVTRIQKKGGVTNSYQSPQPKTNILMSYGCEFFENIGKNMTKYWKIGIHWLTALKWWLAEHFDERAVKILNSS